MSVEEWLPIPGFDDFYSASSYGNIRSEPRDIWSDYDGGGYWRDFKGQALTPTRNVRSGYLYVMLRLPDGKRVNRAVHKLVCLTFHGVCPEGEESRHRNGNQLDNRSENLSYATHSVNIQDVIKHGNHRANSPVCINGHQYKVDDQSVRQGKKYRKCEICRKATLARYRAARKTAAA